MRIPTKLKVCQALGILKLEPEAEAWFDRIEGLYTSLDSANVFPSQLPLLVLLAQQNGVLKNTHLKPIPAKEPDVPALRKKTG